MDESGTRTALQTLLVRLYGQLNIDGVRRSRVGGWLFEKAYLAYKVYLEAGPISSLARYVSPGTWVVDVGANIGVFTLPFAAFVENGKVIAVEPESSNFAALLRRVSRAGLDSAVSAHRGVAAEADGTLFLEINPSHPGDHKLAAVGEPVPAWTLDRLVREHGEPTVSLIKIDVQGAELRVLQGAEGVLARDRPALLIEVDGTALQQQGTSVRALADRLEERGYRPYSFRRGAPAPLSRAQLLAIRTYLDVLFLPDAR